MADEWFRSPDWSKAGQADFWKRYAKSRDKTQDIFIKAVSLLEAGGKRRRAGARELLHRLLDRAEASDEWWESFNDSWAQEQLGKAYEDDAMIEEAEIHYREALRLFDEKHQGGQAHLLLPELVLRTKQRDKYEEMANRLDAVDVDGGTHNDERFRIAVARARLARELGDSEVSSAFARAALDLAEITSPQFPRHANVGLVKARPETLEEMRRLAT
jgi:tetratricopeptide (TPR) repeat protein